MKSTPQSMRCKWKTTNTAKRTPPLPAYNWYSESKCFLRFKCVYWFPLSNKKDLSSLNHQLLTIKLTHSSRDSNKGRYYNKIFLSSFLWCPRKDFMQYSWGTKKTCKIDSAINFVIDPAQPRENVVFRINKNNRYRSKY